MDAIKAIQNYVNKMIDSVSGMKVLLLDEETTPILSITTTQSFLLSREIYLIDKISNSREQMRHLKCIVFIRPTDSINYLLKELQEPKYGDYYIYFSNSCKKSDIERMAEADEFEVVREVQVYYWLKLGILC
jgi:vacuolar protein sorting-associated protein 45